MPIEPQTLDKTPEEERTFEFDFSQQPEFQNTGVTITSVISRTVEPTGPSLGSATFSGAKVQFLITGGAVGNYHLISIVVGLSDGSKLSGFGYLAIVKPVVPA